MSSLGDVDSTVVLHSVPDSLRKQYSLDYMYIRPFGKVPSDLEIDFVSLNKPDLITQIIIRCTSIVDDSRPSLDLIWDLPVGTRIEGLFKIALLSKGGHVDIEINCKNDQCGELMEISITCSDIDVLLKETPLSDFVTLELNEKELTLRKPTGRNLLDWSTKSYADKRDAIRDMLDSLIVKTNDDLDTLIESIDFISRKLEQADPLVNFSVMISCPVCAETGRYEIDSESLALKILYGVQQELLVDIHLLALHYHWTESTILAMPIWRRKKYIGLIRRGDI